MAIEPRATLAGLLLVEDDPRDAELATHALVVAGLPNAVIHAGDGAQALDYLLARGDFADRTPVLPALAILDLELPKVDGIEVLATIRARPELRSLPVIVMTSSLADSRRIEAYELGVNGYLVKSPAFDGLGALAMRMTSSPDAQFSRRRGEAS